MLILNRGRNTIPAYSDAWAEGVRPNLRPIESLVGDFTLRGRRIADQPSLSIKVYLRSTTRGHWEEVAETPMPRSRASCDQTGIAIFPFSPDADHGGIALCERHSPRTLTEDEARRLKILSAVIGYEVLCLQGYGDVEATYPHYLGAILRETRERQALMHAHLTARAGIGASDLDSWERGAGFLQRGSLGRWIAALGLTSAHSRQPLVMIVDVAPQLIQLLKQNPSHLCRLSPDQFEALVAERLERMDFAVQRTGRINAKDGGIDIVAVPKFSGCACLLAVQVKHRRNATVIGRPEVDRLLAWQNSLFHAGMLVTNTGFSRDALWLANQFPAARFLRLKDRDDVLRWIDGNFGFESEWRDIPDTIQLAPGISVKVPKPLFTSEGIVWTRAS